MRGNLYSLLPSPFYQRQNYATLEDEWRIKWQDDFQISREIMMIHQLESSFLYFFHPRLRFFLGKQKISIKSIRNLI